MKKPKGKFARVRHAFLYRLVNGDGTAKVRKAWAAVEYAKEPVDIVLNAEHVKKSIKAKGAGSTSHCAMAVCTHNHADSFPHKVEGHVDWQYSRAFVVTRVDKHGLPAVCRAYEHNDRVVAKLNDTAGGQKKLLEMIEKDGPITITLKPYRKRSEIGRPGKDRKSTGKRDPIKTLKGAKLRYAIYKMGSTPAAA